MKCIKFSCCILIALSFIFALEPVKANLEPLPKLRDDENINQSVLPIPYLGGCQSPGVQIGITTYDVQSYGSFGQRIVVKDNNQVHVDWMWCNGPYPPSPRQIAWNFRYPDGSWYGETLIAPSISGYCQLDITRDVIPDSQRTVICYHYYTGPFYSWIDIEPFGNPSSPMIDGYLWPHIACTENGNIIVATGDRDADMHHLHITTDEGNTWTGIADFDSCRLLSHDLCASHNSDKVVFVHTQFITDSIAGGEEDNNVWYMSSTDGGLTWGSHTNLTNYQPYPTDSVRAYSNVNAIFDMNDNLHIAWTGKRVTDTYWPASKIFHWDEVNDTITIVSSPSIYYPEPGGWWIYTAIMAPGAWRMPADEPQLVVDSTNNDLYCLWLGNDDYSDTSAAGYFNGEIFASKSTDNGLTWTDYANLTNTRTPGAPAGACEDEDYMTAHPFVVNDSIYITYIEDKDAGAFPNTEGIMTTNPVRCWVFHKDLIPGIKEKNTLKNGYTTPILEVYPNPFKEKAEIRCTIHDTRYMMNDYSLKIFDATGQLIKQFNHLTNQPFNQVTWDGYDNTGKKPPSGVYFLEFETSDYVETKKLILLR